MMKQPNIGVSCITSSFYLFDEAESVRDGDNVDIPGEQIDVTQQVVNGLVTICKNSKKGAIVFTSQETGDKYQFTKV